MGLFKSTMAKMGIGNAKVDTILHNPNVNCGEILEGHCVLMGGKVNQQIRYIMINIEGSFDEKDEDGTIKRRIKLYSHKIDINSQIQAGARHEIPFSFRLPVNLPIPTNRHDVRVYTQLDIAKGADNCDYDRITLGMHPMLHTMHNIIELNLGFKLNSINNIYKNANKFYQIVEYKPTQRSPLYNQIDELKFIFTVYEDRIEMIIKIDSKKGLLKEMFGKDKTHLVVSYNINDFTNTDAIANNLYNIILQNKK